MQLGITFIKVTSDSTIFRAIFANTTFIATSEDGFKLTKHFGHPQSIEHLCAIMYKRCTRTDSLVHPFGLPKSSNHANPRTNQTSNIRQQHRSSSVPSRSERVSRAFLNSLNRLAKR